jgi:hypothetical protein
MNIYCGNNQLDPDLINGNLILGSRYKCFKKGIGKGLNLPYDPKFAEDYLPIEDKKLYCGQNEILPNGYNDFGNLSQCLQKGVGIGKRQKALNGPENFSPNITNIMKYKKYLLLFILAIFLFFVLFLVKPNIIIDKDEKTNQIVINWNKFIMIYILIYVPISIFIIIIV